MTILLLLAPLAVLIALLGLWGFWWSVATNQYDDPQGDALRILADDDPP